MSDEKGWKVMKGPVRGEYIDRDGKPIGNAWGWSLTCPSGHGKIVYTRESKFPGKSVRCKPCRKVYPMVFKVGGGRS